MTEVSLTEHPVPVLRRRASIERGNYWVTIPQIVTLTIVGRVLENPEARPSVI